MQDLNARLGQKRLIARELVKLILGLKVPDKNDSLALQYQLDALKNQMRNFESNGFKMKDNDSIQCGITTA